MEGPLKEFFNAVDKKTYWELWCKRCDRGWRMNKPLEGIELKAGNLVHLLNHARSHDRKPSPNTH